ncbi:hypothetical protein NVSP9465_03876 [Novosphingobium sp. CECT 9465]|nr:hypothetical protein NVSP9465_03876 [Novosphingobium sp. CECT 9465]
MQIRRNLRFAIFLEIVRCGYDCEMSGTAQRNSDHITGNEVGRPDAEIEALVNDIN